MCRNQAKKLNKQLFIMINGDHCFEGKKTRYWVPIILSPDDSLEKLKVLRRAVMLTVTVYYRERTQLKSAKGKGRWGKI